MEPSADNVYEYKFGFIMSLVVGRGHSQWSSFTIEYMWKKFYNNLLKSYSVTVYDIIFKLSFHKNMGFAEGWNFNIWIFRKNV